MKVKLASCLIWLAMVLHFHPFVTTRLKGKCSFNSGKHSHKLLLPSPLFLHELDWGLWRGYGDGRSGSVDSLPSRIDFSKLNTARLLLEERMLTSQKKKNPIRQYLSSAVSPAENNAEQSVRQMHTLYALLVCVFNLKSNILRWHSEG